MEDHVWGMIDRSILYLLVWPQRVTSWDCMSRVSCDQREPLISRVSRLYSSMGGVAVTASGEIPGRETAEDETLNYPEHALPLLGGMNSGPSLIILPSHARWRGNGDYYLGKAVVVLSPTAEWPVHSLPRVGDAESPLRLHQNRCLPRLFYNVGRQLIAASQHISAEH